MQSNPQHATAINSAITCQNINLAHDQLQLPLLEQDDDDQDWLHTERSAHQAMWKLGIKHPMALAVLHFMVSKLSPGTNGVVISAATLAKQMGLAPRTVQNTIAILRDCKFVQVLKSGNCNVYVINSHVALQGQRGMRFSVVNNPIIIDETVCPINTAPTRPIWRGNGAAC